MLEHEAESHFQLIADVLRYCDNHLSDEQETQVVHWVAEMFAETLLSTNPRFDSDRFLAACKVPA